ncbi:uncharacterized protein LOC115082692 isoform X2 [Rhinatrema bivittatum]|uniref:uncharacterized protein LOC115082692 isoform X2 n=1 Tax=Rhinatrema bivittatum TaxID=194408 RepID=UPI001126E8C4|nr:uncharacterized protein LOC115082692 isoform X2 [Rhinatrema bivittatum]
MTYSAFFFALLFFFFYAVSSIISFVVKIIKWSFFLVQRVVSGCRSLASKANLKNINFSNIKNDVVSGCRSLASKANLKNINFSNIKNDVVSGCRSLASKANLKNINFSNIKNDVVSGCRSLASKANLKNINFSNIKNDESESSGLAGFINQGATCYLNALLQSLFWTPEFKKEIHKAATKDSGIIKELEDIFHRLEERNHNVETNKLTHYLNLYGGNQQDIAEIFLLIINKLDEEVLAQTGFKKLYKTTLDKYLVCSACKLEEKTECDLILLPLALNTRSVSDALKEFLSPRSMDEDNEIYCDQCQHKTTTNLKYMVKELPQILVIQLKRFEFNFNAKQFMKLLNDIEIPWTLMVDSENGKQEYTLFALCDHYGSCSGGHYTALIKLQPEPFSRWYKFDDCRVTQVASMNNQDDSYSPLSSRTAYLLMYEQTGRQGIMESSRSEKTAASSAETTPCPRKPHYTEADVDLQRASYPSEKEDCKRKEHHNSSSGAGLPRPSQPFTSEQDAASASRAGHIVQTEQDKDRPTSSSHYNFAPRLLAPQSNEKISPEFTSPPVFPEGSAVSTCNKQETSPAADLQAIRADPRVLETRMQVPASVLEQKSSEQKMPVQKIQTIQEDQREQVLKSALEQRASEQEIAVQDIQAMQSDQSVLERRMPSAPESTLEQRASRQEMPVQDKDRPTSSSHCNFVPRLLAPQGNEKISPEFTFPPVFPEGSAVSTCNTQETSPAADLQAIRADPRVLETRMQVPASVLEQKSSEQKMPVQKIQTIQEDQREQVLKSALEQRASEQEIPVQDIQAMQSDQSVLERRMPSAPESTLEQRASRQEIPVQEIQAMWEDQRVLERRRIQVICTANASAGNTGNAGRSENFGEEDAVPGAYSGAEGI